MTAFILSSVLLELAIVELSHVDRDSPTSAVGLERLSKKIDAIVLGVFVRLHEKFCHGLGSGKDCNPSCRIAGPMPQVKRVHESEPKSRLSVCAGAGRTSTWSGRLMTLKLLRAR
jgi:hypothetical protein